MFAIITLNGRSGSTALSATLNKHPYCVCINEPFNACKYDIRRNFEMSNRHLVPPDRDESQIDFFKRALMPFQYGFKEVIWRVDAWNGLIDLGCLMIINTRSQWLEWFVSYSQARESKVWHKDNNINYVMKPITIDLSILENEFNGYVDRLVPKTINLINKAAENQIMFFDYSRIENNFKESFYNLESFLGLPHYSVDIQEEKLNSSSLRKRIVNYDEAIGAYNNFVSKTAVDSRFVKSMPYEEEK